MKNLKIIDIPWIKDIKVIKNSHSLIELNGIKIITCNSVLCHSFVCYEWSIRQHTRGRGKTKPCVKIWKVTRALHSILSQVVTPMSSDILDEQIPSLKQLFWSSQAYLKKLIYWCWMQGAEWWLWEQPAERLLSNNTWNWQTMAGNEGERCMLCTTASLVLPSLPVSPPL